MNAIRLILQLTLISMAGHLYGQWKPTIKLYQNLDVFKMATKQWNADYSDYAILSSGYTYNVGRQAVALSWDLKNNYTNEIQLSFSNSPAVTHTNVTRFSKSSDITRIYTSIGYELSKLLSDKKELIYYSVGISQTLYYYGIYEMPPDDYATREANYGMLMGIVPRVHLGLTDKIEMELNCMLTFLDIKYYTYFVANPQVSFESSWIEKWIKPNLFPGYVNLRLGLCYTF